MAQVDGEAHLLRDDVHRARFHAPCAERDDRWPALLFDQARDLEGHVRRSSHSATTSRDLHGCPACSPSACSAANPARIPSAPSNLPPNDTVSKWEPVRMVPPSSLPGSLPKRLPTASPYTSRPATRIHSANCSRACTQAGLYTGRTMPPCGCQPMAPRASTYRDNSDASTRTGRRLSATAPLLCFSKRYICPCRSP